jgi:hypothetical protein
MLWRILSYFAQNLDSGKSKNESGGRDNLFTKPSMQSKENITTPAYHLQY